MAKTLKELNKEFKDKNPKIKYLNKIAKKMIKKGLEEYNFSISIPIHEIKVDNFRITDYRDRIDNCLNTEHIKYLNEKYNPYFKFTVLRSGKVHSIGERELHENVGRYYALTVDFTMFCEPLIVE